MSIPIRERGLGANIALAFSLVIRNFPKLALVSLIFGLPGLIPEVLQALNPEDWQIDIGPIMVGPQGEGQSLFFPIAWIFSGILSFLFYPLLIGSIIGIVAGSYTGEKVTIGTSMSMAARKFVPLALFGLASTLLIGVGMLMLIVPGMILMTMLYVGSPAIVAEDLGPGAAFNRSSFLSEGSRLQILGYAIMMALIVYIIASVFLAPSYLLSDEVQSGLAFVLVNWAVTSFLGLLMTVAPVIMYFQMRAKREGFQLTSVAELVDRIEQRRAGPDAEGRTR